MRKNGKFIPCEICGTEKYFAQWEQDRRKHFYCSQKCRYEGMSLFYSGENGANYQGGKIEVKCSFCNKLILRDKCQINDTDRHYCSKECMGDYFSIHFTGENHPCYGIKFPESSKRMIKNNPMRLPEVQAKSSETHKNMFVNGYVHPLLGTFATEETRLKQSKAKGGDGLEFSSRIYPHYFSKALKAKIKERDNFICQNCGLSEIEHKEKYKQFLHVHHIDYNKENCKEINLITLCNLCNTKANFNRDYWQAYYSYLIQEKIHEGVMQYE